MSFCSCHACIGGCLSPRTRLLMLETANVSADLLRESLSEYPEAQAMHDPDVYLINFLPPDMRMEVEKDLIVGFTNYIETVAYLLQQNQLPKPRMITSCVKCVPNTNKEASALFASKGGLSEYCLDAVLDACGNFQNVAGLDSLPECANDYQWDYLREVLFANSEIWPCGPYSMFDASGEQDDDGWVHYDTSNWKPKDAEQ
ncbi:hypothetical protein PSENEW3_00001142 [Picochlorum sp. SENEW3]|nr:hypothetical protein PSENEW3_00001142 [Picochlorum sp. SENEW3]